MWRGRNPSKLPNAESLGTTEIGFRMEIDQNEGVCTTFSAAFAMDGAPPKTESVEAAFRPAFEEISRRSNVAQTYTPEEVSFFPRSENACFGSDPLQFSHALVSMGTAVLAPVPYEQGNPSLRVYGTFATRDEAAEHAKIVTEADPTCSLIIVRRGQWILMPQNEKYRDDPDENRRRCQEKLQAFRVRQAEEGDAFDRCVKERASPPRCGGGGSDDGADEETAEAERLVYKPPRRIRAGVEVRGQSIVALCVIPDEYGECLFNVVGCFESGAEADAWIQNVGSRTITNDNIHVAATCEWLYPNGKIAAPSHYRNPELQRIMDAAERNPEMVRSYKEWKRMQEEKEAEAELTSAEEGGTADVETSPQM